MHHIPAPQDQARILATSVKEALGAEVPHQTALELVAKVMGHKDWKTMSAAFETAREAKRVQLEPLIITGPEDGDLYEGIVTVDISMSGVVRVRANSLEEAKDRLEVAGHEQFPRGFRPDEENYRSRADFYLGDEDAVENLSKVVFDRDGSNFGSATWKDDKFEYSIRMSRENPDSSDEDDWAEVGVTLEVTSREDESVSHSKDIKDYEVHRDSLTSWIAECMREGDFEEDFEKLKKKVKSLYRKKHK